MKKIYAVLNLLVILAVIFWNYYANANGINGNTVGSLSDEYANLFTPAGYAFSIWGLIFLGLVAHGIFQVYRAFGSGDDEFILKIGPWLILANLGNGAWIWFWLTEQTLFSVFIMLIILISLLTIVVKLNMEKWDAPASIIAWVWWPICLYSGWIAVATIANIAAYLAKTNWSGGLSEITWTIIMLIVATAVNLYMIYSRNMREFAAVGVWALVAISVRHWGNIPALQWTALLCALLLTVVIIIHGFKRRNQNPFFRKVI